MTTRDEWIEHHVEDVLFDVDAEDTTEHRQLAKAYLRDAMAFADAHPVVESAFEKPVRGIIAEVGNVTYSPTPEPAGAVDAPSRIYLQHDPEDTGEPFTQAAGVTWCQDRINATDIEYVRADALRDGQEDGVNILREVSSEWEHTANAGEVRCHSRMIEGVLCRWWGDGPEPKGVAIIDGRIIEPVGMREALAKCLEELRWCSGSPDFNEGGQAREGWKRGPMLAIEQAVTALAACDKPVVEKVMEVSQLGFCSARLRDIGFTSSD